MKKKWAAILCGILCLCLLATPVYAQGSGPDIDITEGGMSEGEAIVAGTQPVSVTAGSAGDVPTITKVYELPQGADTAACGAAFDQDGFLFTLHDTSQRVQQGQTDTKPVTQIETLESESGKLADIITEAEPVLPYSEDGYTGQLALDTDAIAVEENGTSNYSYRVEDVQEYTSLDRNDAAYVPKTVLKNGVTLQLENIEWVVMGQHPVDGRMVPNLFTAVATYAGTATGSRATGYTATLPYAGTVTKTIPGMMVFTAIFHGEPLATAGEADTAGKATDEPVSAEEKESKGLFTNVVLNIIIVLLVAACLAVGGLRIIQYIRKRRSGDDDTDFAVEDFPIDEPYSAPGPERSVLEDARQFPQASQQTYSQDEFSIDDLFNEEGVFNG